MKNTLFLISLLIFTTTNNPKISGIYNYECSTYYELIELNKDSTFKFSYNHSGLGSTFGKTSGIWTVKDSVITLKGINKSLLKKDFGKVNSYYNQTITDSIQVTIERLNKHEIGAMCSFIRDKDTILCQPIIETDTLRIINKKYDEIIVWMVGFRSKSTKIKNNENQFHFVIEEDDGEKPFYFKEKKFLFKNNKLYDLTKRGKRKHMLEVCDYYLTKKK